MEKKQVIWAVIAIAVVLAASALVIIGNDNDTEGKNYSGYISEDTIGHWYCTDVIGYHSDGEFFDYDLRSETSKFDFEVYGIDNGLMYGWFMDINVSGILDRNQIHIYAADENTSYTLVGNVVSPSSIVCTILVETDNGTSKDICIKVARYSNTLETQTLDEYSGPDISGNWYAARYDMFNVDGYIDYPADGSLTVTSQNKFAFSGTMEQYFDGRLSNVDIRGIVIDGAGNSSMGYAADSNGVLWHVSLANGYMVLTANRSVVLENSGESETVSVAWTYSRNADEKLEAIEPISVDDTVWKCISGTSVDNKGKFSTITFQQFISITDQTGPLYSGVMLYGVDEIKFAGYMDMATPTGFWGDNDYLGRNLTISHGWIEKDYMYFTYTYLEESGNLVTTYNIYEKAESAESESISGHWYASMRIGYDENNEYQVIDIIDAQIGDYDLDVYVEKDGLFYGRYMDEQITGDYIGELMIISGGEESQRYKLIGSMTDENVLILHDLYCSDPGEDGKTTAYMTVLTKDRGAISAPVINLDITGSWTSLERTIYDGTTIYEDPATLVIEDMENGLFYGTIDRTDTDMAFKGIVISYGADGMLQGYIIGAEGNTWNVTFEDDQMIMSSTGQTIGYDGVTAAERIYTRDGSGERPTPKFTDLSGTWSADEVRIVSETGTFKTLEMDYTLTIGKGENNKYVGKGYMGDYVYGDVALLVYKFNNMENVMISSDYGKGEDNGYGWIDPDGTMTLIEEYTDSVGKQWTQISVFSKIDSEPIFRDYSESEPIAVS